MTAKEEEEDLTEAVRMFLNCLDQYGLMVQIGDPTWRVVGAPNWFKTSCFCIGPEDCGGSWLSRMRELANDGRVLR